jgi:hypothetical protein
MRASRSDHRRRPSGRCLCDVSTRIRRAIAQASAPLLDMSRLTLSMTSTKASFFRYLTSDLRQDVAPVAWMVILDESSRCAKRSTRRNYCISCTTHYGLLGLDALGRDEHLEGVGLGVLRIAKVEDLCARSCGRGDATPCRCHGPSRSS